MSKRFVILDRDGTLNVERNYLSQPQDVELLPGAVEGLQLLQAHGFAFVVVTNQSGVARGFFARDAVDRVNERLSELLQEHGIQIAEFYVCPHVAEDNCQCRKPRTGMIEAAIEEHGFLPHEAIVIGDRPSDIELGQRVGAMTILVRTGYGEQWSEQGFCDPSPTLVADNLHEAAKFVVRNKPAEPMLA